MPDSKSDHVMKKAKVSTGSDKRERKSKRSFTSVARPTSLMDG